MGILFWLSVVSLLSLHYRRDCGYEILYSFFLFICFYFPPISKYLSPIFFFISENLVESNSPYQNCLSMAHRERNLLSSYLLCHDLMVVKSFCAFSFYHQKKWLRRVNKFQEIRMKRIEVNKPLSQHVFSILFPHIFMLIYQDYPQFRRKYANKHHIRRHWDWNAERRGLDLKILPVINEEKNILYVLLEINKIFFPSFSNEIILFFLFSNFTSKSVPVPKKKKIHDTHKTQVVYIEKAIHLVSLKFSGTWKQHSD